MTAAPVLYDGNPGGLGCGCARCKAPMPAPAFVSVEREAEKRAAAVARWEAWHAMHPPMSAKS